jgi:hypothetical protein
MALDLNRRATDRFSAAARRQGFGEDRSAMASSFVVTVGPDEEGVLGGAY